MALVEVGPAVVAEGSLAGRGGGTVKAKHVTFAAGGGGGVVVCSTYREEWGGEESFQPWRHQHWTPL